MFEEDGTSTKSLHPNSRTSVSDPWQPAAPGLLTFWASSEVSGRFESKEYQSLRPVDNRVVDQHTLKHPGSQRLAGPGFSAALVPLRRHALRGAHSVRLAQSVRLNNRGHDEDEGRKEKKQPGRSRGFDLEDGRRSFMACRDAEPDSRRSIG